MFFNGQPGDRLTLGDESLMIDTFLHSSRHQNATDTFKL